MPTNAIFPPLTLIGDVSEAADLDWWYEDDGFGDPWLGMPYRWTMTITLRGPQTHSSHKSRVYMMYDAQDIQVGDWIADLSTAKAVKITAINTGMTTDSVLVCEVEDIDRFNTFSDFTQSGIGRPDGLVSIFRVGKDGLPVFGPVSQYSSMFGINSVWTADVLSNFRYRNLIRDSYRVKQPGHDFVVGEPIYLKSDSTYARAGADVESATRCVGTINSVGTPGQDWFTYQPIAPITTHVDPILPGNPGDLIYLGANGTYTATKPSEFANPIYIKIDETSGILLDRGLEEPINNLKATAAPTSTDDSSKGYEVGSFWFDLSDVNGGQLYICKVSTVGSAVWVKSGGSTGGGTSSAGYQHIQDVSSQVWVVQHNKGSTKFTYNAFDSSGEQFIPERLQIVSPNEIKVYLNVADIGIVNFTFF